MSNYKLGVNNARRKKYNRRMVLIGMLCLAALVGAVYLMYVPSRRPEAQSPKRGVASQQSLPHVVNYGLPVRLRIPEIAVDALITYVGLTKTGAMAAPDSIVDVGWYKGGVLPGNKGSAVLAGHIDGLRGEPGVFAHLDKLQRGDTLLVLDSNGSTVAFIVRDVRTYGQDEKPSEVFNAVDGVHLNLITCAGDWDNTQHHFMERLVVFADKR